MSNNKRNHRRKQSSGAGASRRLRPVEVKGGPKRDRLARFASRAVPYAVVAAVVAAHFGVLYVTPANPLPVWLGMWAVPTAVTLLAQKSARKKLWRPALVVMVPFLVVPGIATWAAAIAEFWYLSRSWVAESDPVSLREAVEDRRRAVRKYRERTAERKARRHGRPEVTVEASTKPARTVEPDSEPAGSRHGKPSQRARRRAREAAA